MARLTADAARQKNWKRWGPYLAERQWATVREDYSRDGTVWNYFEFASGDPGRVPPVLFTHNETNLARLYGAENASPFVKDAFHDLVVHGKSGAVNPKIWGTKAAPYYRLHLASGESQTVRLRLYSEAEAPSETTTSEFDAVVADRIREADEFYDSIAPVELSSAERNVVRQGYAGLMWSKQFYHSPAASSVSTTSACSTARSRGPAAAQCNRPTAPRGWRFTASACSAWRSNLPVMEGVSGQLTKI